MQYFAFLAYKKKYVNVISQTYKKKSHIRKRGENKGTLSCLVKSQLTTWYISKGIFFPLTVGMCHCDAVSLRTDGTVMKLDTIFGAGLHKWLPV